MAHLSDQPALVRRVRRLSGQLAAVERSLAEGADCAAVLQQAAAVRGAVDALVGKLIEAHLAEHVAAPGLTDAARGQGAREVLAAIRRYAR